MEAATSQSKSRDAPQPDNGDLIPPMSSDNAVGMNVPTVSSIAEKPAAEMLPLTPVEQPLGMNAGEVVGTAAVEPPIDENNT
eukprot:3519642-Pleurochrysis_carterae.AAC.1